MIATGVAFALSNTYAVILLIAFLGTINPSAVSVSVFVPLEHMILSRAAADHDRTRMFARYSLIGAIAAAVGARASGSPDLLTNLGVTQATVLKGMFLLYAVLGVAGGLAYAQISAGTAPHDERHVSALGPVHDHFCF